MRLSSTFSLSYYVRQPEIGARLCCFAAGRAPFGQIVPSMPFLTPHEHIPGVYTLADNAGVSGVAEANKAFSPEFDFTYTSHLQRKFGLTGMELGGGWVDALRSGGTSPCEMKAGLSSDAQFVWRFFQLMSTCETDFTDTWRALLDVPALSKVPKMTPGGLEVRLVKEVIAGGQVSTPVGLDDAGTRASGGSQNRESTAEECCTRDGDGSELPDEDALRPLVSVLRAAGVSSDQMRGWAEWTREYMARIDTQASLCERFHGLSMGLFTFAPPINYTHCA